MPSSTNKFVAPISYDHIIANAEDGSKVGEIRIKPSSVLWKPKGGQKYHSVSMTKFAEWIEHVGNLAAK